MSNRNILLDDDELSDALYDIALEVEHDPENEEIYYLMQLSELKSFINTQKRLYAESEQAEQKAIISALAERLNDAIKKGRKYIKISEVEYSIGKNLAEQRARIK